MSQPAPERRLPIRRHPRVVARRLQDSGVLVNLETNEIFELNDTAMRVWEWLDGSAGVAEMAHRLSLEFDVTSEVAEREVRALLARFAEQGLGKA